MKIVNSKLEILQVLSYFSFFSYAPSVEEIHVFLGKRASINELQASMDILVKEKNVVKKALNKLSRSESPYRYTLVGYSTAEFWRTQQFKVQSSKFKVKKIIPYVRLLSNVPQIQLIGLSGSVAMMNAQKEDDIDLFIITTSNRLWTGRAIANGLAFIYGLKRRRGTGEGERVKDKVCLNLFFDEQSMGILPKKRTQYVAHEVLQMKPLFEHEHVYKRFLEANSWVFTYFPNAPRLIPSFLSLVRPRLLPQRLAGGKAGRKKSLSLLGIILEAILKNLQLFLINCHRTTEIITPTQLWFFPDDFEKKMQSLVFHSEKAHH